MVEGVHSFSERLYAFRYCIYRAGRRALWISLRLARSWLLLFRSTIHLRARWKVAGTMTWIRGPSWDGCWILSGLPLGIIASILAIWISPFWLLASGVVLFQTGHSLSPIALAWMHKGYRRYLLAHPWKFVAAPVVILASATFAGWASGASPIFDSVTLKINQVPPLSVLWVLAITYTYWNIYHFGKQNFGVMSIYRQKTGSYAASQRRFDLVYSCLTAWSIMVVSTIHLAANYFRISLLGYWQVLAAYLVIAAIGMAIMLWREWREARLCAARIVLILTNGVGMGTAMFWWLGGVGIVSMNHWLVAIGLAGHASRRPWLLPLAVILAGIVLFCALFPDVRHLAVPTRVAAWAIAFRLALGFVHFLYDRWVWKLSDPHVQATIGQVLLERREAKPCKWMAATGA